MVAKMKKFTFLAFYRDYDAFLHDLRDLGLIHVAASDRPVEDNEQLDEFLVKLKQLREAQKILNRQIDKKSAAPLNEPDIERGKTIPREIELIQNATASLNQQLQVSIKERELLRPWGNFDPENIERLRKAGYLLDFFIVPDNQYNPEWETTYDAVVVKRETSRTYFVTLTQNEKVADELNLESVKIPGISLTQLDGLIASLREKIQVQDQKLKALAAELPSLKAAIGDIEQRMNYTRVHQSGTSLADDKLMLLQGWAPADNQREISDYLELKAVYFDVADPTPDDEVPIKFKNNKFARLFEPIAELYMLPKYNEIDLTPYFAPFYMVFFGLSLGDVGYGLFLFTAATLAKILQKSKLSTSMKAILSLVQVLGASTMVTGLLTGGFFGFALYDLDWPIVQALKEKAFFDNNRMFMLSLVLGVVQVLFGMCMKVFNRIKQQGFKYSLSTVGWIVLLVSFIVAALLPNALPMFGTVHLIVLIPAALLIYFYNSPDKNPFLNLGIGLWDTYNMATGLLGDVLSYVRLFALGLSGGILASVFNSLAAGMSPDNAIAKPIVYVLIFLIGHAINIFMNTLGAIVHPVRLTFVEFYKNSEFEGGGKKYSPFRK
ncbi:V-type ATP synthase subunit I [Petrimonas sulfuriphila]|jgi:V/A-type H+-transporting ATPase subunit I|uniref:V-type ATP synthase subunit I n=1 Tax=Petrimonas TaxID=307628 RepID=UPI000E9CB987|nr:V-type ATPase 116kDa subunit family protein [Petrimonas sp.]HBQ57423.1 V-type ATP synthase subunit I [Porphyromonadaceae bacterium]MDD4014064.1 V-type ATPase 116kDa subunit family protein [Petrimonas sp.]MDD4846987.1 V-type ATPase 116kDa subunit family protein [Petrimonas sp.]HBU46259.1 V-type ATP synthase subunit I [Porphyromonadaceae bacterium]